MSVAPKPKGKPAAPPAIADERKATTYIEGAGKGGEKAEKEEKAEKAPNKIPIMLRFSPDLLKRVDAAARSKGISRSAWIHFMVSKTLEQDNE